MIVCEKEKASVQTEAYYLIFKSNALLLLYNIDYNFSSFFHAF